MLIELSVNGRPREVDVPERASLLALLRDGLHLFGTKNGCEEGECGSCAVWLDGDVVNACLVLAAQAAGRDVRTIESIGSGGTPDRVQQAFVDAGAVQCGFCTPGLVVAVTDLLRHEPHPSDQVIREALSGHLCRCTGYRKIVDAVRLAAEAQR